MISSWFKKYFLKYFLCTIYKCVYSLQVEGSCLLKPLRSPRSISAEDQALNQNQYHYSDLLRTRASRQSAVLRSFSTPVLRPPGALVISLRCIASAHSFVILSYSQIFPKGTAFKFQTRHHCLEKTIVKSE